MPEPFATTVTVRSQIVPGEDLHTVTVTAGLLPGHTYDFSHIIKVAPNNPGLLISDASAGVVQTVGDSTITITLTNIPQTLPTTTTATGLVAIAGGGVTELDVHDVIVVSAAMSDITGFSNSFLETGVPIPEPASFALLGAGLAGLGLVRRRHG